MESRTIFKKTHFELNNTKESSETAQKESLVNVLRVFEPKSSFVRWVECLTRIWNLS